MTTRKNSPASKNRRRHVALANLLHRRDKYDNGVRAPWHTESWRRKAEAEIKVLRERTLTQA